MNPVNTPSTPTPGQMKADRLPRASGRQVGAIFAICAERWGEAGRRAVEAWLRNKGGAGGLGRAEASAVIQALAAGDAGSLAARGLRLARQGRPGGGKAAGEEP